MGSRVFRTGMLCCSFAANKHDLDYLLLTCKKTYVTNLTFRLGIIHVWTYSMGKNIKSTELENNTKLNDLEILKGKGMEETSKLTFQRTTLGKLHEARHLLERKMEDIKFEEETVYKAKEVQEIKDELSVLKKYIQDESSCVNTKKNGRLN